MAAVFGLAGLLAVLTSAAPASAHEETKLGRYNAAASSSCSR